MPRAKASQSRGPHSALFAGRTCMRSLQRAWRSPLAVLPAANAKPMSRVCVPESFPAAGWQRCTRRERRLSAAAPATRLRALLATRMALRARGIARRERHAYIASLRAASSSRPPNGDDARVARGGFQRPRPQRACMLYLQRAWRSALAVLPAANAKPMSQVCVPESFPAAGWRRCTRRDRRLSAAAPATRPQCACMLYLPRAWRSARGMARRERHAYIAGLRARVLRGRRMATMHASREAAFSGRARNALACSTCHAHGAPRSRYCSPR